MKSLVNMILATGVRNTRVRVVYVDSTSIFLIVLLSSFELQVSISKFVAEQEERFHRNILYHAITITIIFTSILFLVAAAILPFIPVFNAYHPYVRWLVMILIPVISFTSVARGYFMGMQQMGKIAVSNFLRKIIQLGGLFVLFRFFAFDPEAALLVAIGTLIGSEIIVFLYLIYLFIVTISAIETAAFFQFKSESGSEKFNGGFDSNNRLAFVFSLHWCDSALYH